MKNNKKVVFCNMVGDLFHYGHMKFIEKVRNYFNEEIYLIVGLTSDEDAKQYKRIPILTFEERIQTIRASKLVDYVMDIPAPLVETVKFLDDNNIDYSAHGDDFTEDTMILYYGEIISANRFIIVPYERELGISTSEIIRRIKNIN
jgi:cytidyltransferase-like protein